MRLELLLVDPLLERGQALLALAVLDPERLLLGRESCERVVVGVGALLVEAGALLFALRDRVADLVERVLSLLAKRLQDGDLRRLLVSHGWPPFENPYGSG